MGGMALSTSGKMPSGGNSDTSGSYRKSAVHVCTRSASSKDGAIVVDTDKEIEDYYDMGANICVGGFAVVRKAVCKADGTEVAVKCVSKDNVFSSGLKSMFIAETQIGSALEHPQICWLRASYHDSESIYLISELGMESTLFDKLYATIKKRENKQNEAKEFQAREIEYKGFGEKEACGYIWQMACAIAHCHKHMICHRDIKTENFVMVLDGMTERVKLIDFSLARVFQNGTPMVTKVGSMNYVAPEILDGQYTEACDCWSLGVASFLCCTGQFPLYNEKEHELIRRVKQGSVEWSILGFTKCGQEVVSLFESLLVKDVPKRASARKWADDPWFANTAKTAGNSCCALL